MLSLLMGIDVGGTSIKIGALEDSGKLKHELSIPTESNIEALQFLENLWEAIERLLNHLDHQKEKVISLGIGFPGSIDLKTGTILSAWNIPFLKGYNLKEFLNKKLEEKYHSIPILLQNDASCAALGHKYFGEGKEYSDFAVFTLGTGVGGGVILNHKLWGGYAATGFEIGHSPVANDAIGNPEYYVECSCGNKGCLETYSSATAVVNIWKYLKSKKEKDMSKINPLKEAKQISQLAEEGDLEAIHAFKIAGRSLGFSSSILVQILNLPLIIFSGGMSTASKWFAVEIEKMIQKQTFPYLFSRLKLKFTEGNEDFGIKGAAALYLDDLRQKKSDP